MTHNELIVPGMSPVAYLEKSMSSFHEVLEHARPNALHGWVAGCSFPGKVSPFVVQFYQL